MPDMTSSQGSSTRPDLFRDGTTAAYHITHVENLSSLVECGVLYCDRLCTDDGRQPISIAYTSLKETRSRTIVRVAAGGTLADYVPFYFAPRSPMLYVIWQGGVEGYTGGQEPIVHLLFSLEHLAEPGRFVITDGHAATPLSTQYDTLDALERIDWKIMRASYWADTDEDGDRKRRRQAEFLVHQQVPITALRGIVAIDDEVAARAKQAVAELPEPPNVVVHPAWYY